MTCQDCESAKTKPHHPIYTSGCPGCEARKLDGSPSEFNHRKHLSNLKTIPGTADRRAYIEAVQRIESKAKADRLRKDFSDWWEAGKP
jgi:hypothetical protein